MMNLKPIAALLLCVLILLFSFFAGAETCTQACCTEKAQPIMISDDIMLTDSILSSGVLVCTLTGPEQQERKEALEKDIFSQVKSIEEIDKGYIFMFEDSNTLLIKIMDYIIVEKECCPFFEYNISVQAYSKGLELKITGGGLSKYLISMFVQEIQNDRK